MTKRLVAVALAAALSAVSLFSVTSVSATDKECGIGKNGVQLVLAPTGACIDPTPPTANQLEISDAKQTASAAYSELLNGTGSEAASDEANAKLADLTGAPMHEPQPNGIAVANGTAPGSAPSASLSGFQALQQINEIFCGPASIQSMLYYFYVAYGSQYLTSATYDTVTSAYDQINGGGDHDQNILANTFWLATVQNGGTNWGNLYMPFTLNGWRGDSWYQQNEGPGLDGAFTKSGYMSDVQYDTDFGYPLAENVKYSVQSYRPSGFNQAGTYEHWDTVYGQFNDGTQYVQIGQVYASPGYTYVPHQAWELDIHWKAIEIHHGIVW